VKTKDWLRKIILKTSSPAKQISIHMKLEGLKCMMNVWMVFILLLDNEKYDFGRYEIAGDELLKIL